jgi:ATP-dependent DNA helicase RecG
MTMQICHFAEAGMRGRVTVRLAEVLTAQEVLDRQRATTMRLESAESRLESAESRLESEAPRLESRLESALAASVLLLLNEAKAGKAQLAKLLGHKKHILFAKGHDCMAAPYFLKVSCLSIQLAL